MATRDFYPGAGDGALVLQASADGQPLTIPDAHFLFTANYDRDGSDLILSDESGQSVIVEGYFAAVSPPDLASPEGALVRAPVVESLAGPLAPGQYAQAGTPTGAAPIGKVESLDGTATAQRTDGTTVTLKVGDPVFQGDVVTTSADSKVGVTFIDQTVFTLSENARMVLDELVYSPGGSDNSMLINLVQGTFVFVAGQVAPTGDMKVQTPVATIGIRGTTILATVAETLKTWVITPTEAGQPPTVISKPQEELASDQELLTFLYETYQTASASFSTNQGGDGNNGADGGANSVPGSGIDSGAGQENQSLTIDVLSNDSDVDRDDDPSNFVLSEANISSVSGVESGGGTVAIVDNRLQFTPGTSFDSLNVGDIAEVVIDYTMTDDEGALSSAQVLLTVSGENDAPTVDIPVLGGTGEDTGLNVPGITITDVDNETLTVTITEGSTVTLADTSGLSSVEGNGTHEVVIEGSVDAINAALNADNGLLYTPSNDFSGDGTLIFKLEDGTVPATGTVQIAVVPVNDAPALGGDRNLQVAEGDGVIIELSDLTAIDPDDAGTGLTYEVTQGPSNGHLELTSAAGAAIVSFTQADLDSGLVRFVHDGSFTFFPGEGFQGFASFEFTVTDQTEASTAQVTVEVDQQEFINDDGQTITFGIDGDSPLSSGIGVANVEIDVSEVSGSAINVSFAFDSSGSLGQDAYDDQFDAIKTAIRDIRTEFEGSQTQVDVQLVQFGTGVYVKTYDLTELTDEVLDSDQFANEFAYTAGWTNYDAALLEVESFFASQPGETNFLFFSSDGVPILFGTPQTAWESTAQGLQEVAIISAFGIGTGINLTTLNKLDNTGGAVTGLSADNLSGAFADTPIFAADLVDFSLKLVADGVDHGEIATTDDLKPDDINFDLPLADVPNISDLLGEQNQFTATATFDFDGDPTSTDDQITLFSAETVSVSPDPVNKTGTSGNDLLLGSNQADQIDGASGADVILGFAGNDRLEVSDATFKTVDGGAGKDTLVLDDTDLDLSNIDATNYTSIEAIELKNDGQDTLTLTLDYDSVKALSETTNEDLDAVLDQLLGSANVPEDSLVVTGSTLPNGDQDTVILAPSTEGEWSKLSEDAFADHDIYAFQDSSGTVLAAVAIDDDVAVPGIV